MRGDVFHIEAGPSAYDLPMSGETVPAALQAELRGGAGAILLLPPAVVLRRPMELPIAVAPELHSAASFLVEKLTPFPLEQACHAARLLSRDRARKTLRAEVAVTPRATLERLLAAVDAYGIPLRAIRVEGDTASPPLDFLPHHGGQARTVRPAPA